MTRARGKKTGSQRAASGAGGRTGTDLAARAAKRPPRRAPRTTAISHFNNLLGSADIALIRLARDRTIERFSIPATRLFRLRPSDLGRPIDKIKPRFKDPRLCEDIDAALMHRQPRENEVYGEDGRWYLRRIAPSRTLADRIVGAVLTFTEVTQLKHAQRELRTLAAELERRVAQRTVELEAESSARARTQQTLRDERNFINAILDTAGALIVVLDADGCVERFNQSCEATVGRSEDELRGQSWKTLVPEEEHAAVQSVFDGLLAGHLPSQHENHWLRRDGSRRLVSWSNTRLLDERGAVEHVVAIGIDVTERRCAEAEVVRRQAEVARLHRLHAMGALAALLAHELNQPLAAIASFGEASLGQLQRGEPGDRLQRNLEQIVEQARRASRSIGELREFLTKKPPGEACADFNAVLGTACGLVEGLARARGVRLDCECEQSLPKVAGQAMHIEHVLVNLLQNALDAMRDAGRPGGRVTVRVRRDGKERVLASVTDDGLGLERGLLHSVFEPLYTTKTDGLGLGLSICRTIVEAQGGRIWAEPGPGGKFFFTLPVVS